MIKGLSPEELSPEKDNTDVVEIKDETPKIHKQIANKLPDEGLFNILDC